MNNKSNIRNSNIDILKLLCMFIIILHHIILYSNILDISGNSINKYFSIFLFMLGKIGSDCFFAISSYFLLNSKFKIDKFKKIYISMIFYSFLFFGLNIIFNFREFNFIDIGETIFPFFYNSYWFITAYLTLMLISPFLNKLIFSINKKQHFTIIALLLLCISLPATLLPKANAFHSYIHFPLVILIYFIVSYIKLYKMDTLKIKKMIIIFIISTLLLLFSAYFMIFIGNLLSLDVLKSHSTFFMTDESIFTLISSISLCLIALLAKQRNIKFINTVSKGTLDIYLIHMNHYIYIFIWTKLFKVQKMYSSNMYMLYIISIASVVFAVCLIIGIIRNKLQEKTETLFDNTFNKITTKLRKYLQINEIDKTLY